MIYLPLIAECWQVDLFCLYADLLKRLFPREGFASGGPALSPNSWPSGLLGPSPPCGSFHLKNKTQTSTNTDTVRTPFFFSVNYQIS